MNVIDSIVVRQVKHLNNIIEQDHRAIKLVTSRCSTSKRSGRPAPCGPAFMHMKKGATLLDKMPDGIHTIHPRQQRAGCRQAHRRIHRTATCE
ncbi:MULTISPECIES: hypothetical protein [Pseudomonas]|uniref:hypothetical protein n=1 Tax=Pseudomonas TaxID=286 RepID=UPI0005D37962|nr:MULTISPECIES: hypothetical protein [Pseudomonas]KJH78097.1 hypothetical protein UB23_04970 [Pseudomonas sp. ES3-33]